MLFTADLKAFAEKKVKVEKFAITTTTVTIKKETGEGGEKKLEGVIKHDTGVTTARVKRERKPKVETRDESEDEDGESVDEDANTKVGRREKSKRKVKTEIKEEKCGEIRELGVESITAAKKGRRGQEVGKKMRTRVKLEDGAKEMPVKEEKASGRTSKFGDGDIELGEAGMTMADRIKRRRRQ